MQQRMKLERKDLYLQDQVPEASISCLIHRYSKLEGLKILLVEDDERIRNSLRLLFESEGCHLLALENAEEAIETLKKQEYDIIIADYRLQGMNGLEFLKLIHESHRHGMKILIGASGIIGFSMGMPPEAIRKEV